MQQIKRRKSEWQRLSTPGRQKRGRFKVTEGGWSGGGEAPMPPGLKLGRREAIRPG